jgi:hypothetical protein
MSSIFDLLMDQLGGDTVGQISRAVGAREEDTQKALPDLLGVLTGALSRNSASSDGAQALAAALDKDHDGNVLDNIPDYIDNYKNGPGEGILRHVLGANRSAMEQNLSQKSGMDAGTIGNLLTMLAPLLMGALGKSKRQGGLDVGALAGLLGAERSRAEQAAPASAGLLTQLLDADGDGQIADDVGKIGVGLLGKLFGKRR